MANMACNLLDFLDQEIADLDQQIADIELRLQNARSPGFDTSDMSVRSSFSQRTFLQAPAQSTRIIVPEHLRNSEQISSPIKLPFPVFDPHNIEIWLWSIDKWFLASGVSSDEVKFNAVLLALPTESLAILKSELDTPPTSARYEFFKNIVVKHFAKNQMQRILSLLTEVELNGRKPSALFIEMK